MNTGVIYIKYFQRVGKAEPGLVSKTIQSGVVDKLKMNFMVRLCVCMFVCVCLCKYMLPQVCEGHGSQKRTLVTLKL